MRFGRRSKEEVSQPRLALGEAASAWATNELGPEYNIEGMESAGFGEEDKEAFRRWRVITVQ